MKQFVPGIFAVLMMQVVQVHAYDVEREYCANNTDIFLFNSQHEENTPAGQTDFQAAILDIQEQLLEITNQQLQTLIQNPFVFLSIQDDPQGTGTLNQDEPSAAAIISAILENYANAAEQLMQEQHPEMVEAINNEPLFAVMSQEQHDQIMHTLQVRLRQFYSFLGHAVILLLVIGLHR